MDPERLAVKLGVVGDNRFSFLQFDIRAAGGFVSDAKIFLKVYGARDVHDIYAFNDNSCKEGTITWNIKPTFTTILDSRTIGVEVESEGTYIHFDVTTHINNLVAANAQFASFAIAASATSYDLLIKYFSKEAASADRPKLEVTFTPSGVGDEEQTPSTMTSAEPSLAGLLSCRLQSQLG